MIYFALSLSGSFAVKDKSTHTRGWRVRASFPANRGYGRPSPLNAFPLPHRLDLLPHALATILSKTKLHAHPIWFIDIIDNILNLSLGVWLVQKMIGTKTKSDTAIFYLMKTMMFYYKDFYIWKRKRYFIFILPYFSTAVAPAWQQTLVQVQSGYNSHLNLWH